MKKIICKREYDTETSELIKKNTVGTFGDPAGYEESLYRKPMNGLTNNQQAIKRAVTGREAGYGPFLLRRGLK